MGYFDCLCIESGLWIDGPQQLVPLVGARPSVGDRYIDFIEMTWEPLALPIAGQYNGYGTMEDPDEIDENVRAVLAFGSHIAVPDGDADGYVLGELLDDIRGDGPPGGTWNKRPVSFGLVDGRIYRAIVDAVAANGETAWRRYAELGFDDADLWRLRKSLLENPSDEATRKVYIDLLLERDDPRGKILALLPTLDDQPADVLAPLVLPHAGAVYAHLDALRPALVDFVRFRAWGTRLQVTFGGVQFEGYEGDEEALEHARARYAGMPDLLAAVDENERAWRDRFAQ